MIKLLDENKIDKLIQPFTDRQEAINVYVIKKIAKRVQEIGELLPSDVQKLEVLYQVGADVRAINAEIAKQTKRTVKDIKALIKDVAEGIYLDAKPYYDYKEKPLIPLRENERLQRTVRAVAKDTADTFKNLSNAQAFMLRDPIDRKKFIPTSIAETYQKTVDFAIQATQQGTIDYNTAIRKSMQELTESGLRVVDYETEGGRFHSQRLDTAVKRNILSGIRMINGKVQEQIAEEIGADGIEISVHIYPAPDHAPIQGHQFTNENYEKMQSSESFTDYNGNQFEAIERHITELNCRHYPFAVLLGVMPPNYTEDELKEILKTNEDGITLDNGKRLTMYQCTQKQRDFELKIRKAKEEQAVAKTLKDDILISKSTAKIADLVKQYRAFSKKCKLPLYWENTII